jgi:regulator of cell morphogenesis and NO signaling
MKETEISTRTIGEIVASDHRAAKVFMEAGIDFCCGGKKSIFKACEEKNINLSEIIKKLDELESTPNTTTHNFNEWEPGFLADYIVNTHHKYVLKSLPEIVFYTRKIAEVHGDRHTELIEVAEIFSQVNKELLQHLKNEEEVLFPAIREVIRTGSADAKSVVNSEILRMSGEHEFAGGAIDHVNEITNNYMIPSDGCNSYNVAFKMLREFEDDLHIHVHLENNILYRKALELSK